jgi:hypothetical protein
MGFTAHPFFSAALFAVRRSLFVVRSSSFAVRLATTLLQA